VIVSVVYLLVRCLLSCLTVLTGSRYPKTPSSWLSHIVRKQLECRVRSKRPDRAEVTAIEGEHGIGAVLSGQRDVHRVGQVQVESRILALDLARCLKQADRYVRDEEPLALRLKKNEIDEG
jgi:hypothetical protein